MSRITICLFLFFTSLSAYAVDCKKHPIYCQVVKNKPSIDKKFAMKLSNVIYKMHRKYHIPSRIFTAILMQESGYTLKTNGCHKGLVKNPYIKRDINICLNTKEPEGPPPTERGYFNSCIDRIPMHVEVEVCSDFGISQIYYKTAQRFKIDITRLTTDLEYSVEAGARVLHDFMERHEAKDNDWWVRYNCGSKGTTKRDTCQIYKKLVERYL